MNKNIEPGKTLYYLREGMGYLWLALTAKSKRTRQTAWLAVKQYWLWPLISLAVLAIVWRAVFHFVGW